MKNNSGVSITCKCNETLSAEAYSDDDKTTVMVCEKCGWGLTIFDPNKELFGANK